MQRLLLVLLQVTATCAIANFSIEVISSAVLDEDRSVISEAATAGAASENGVTPFFANLNDRKVYRLSDGEVFQSMESFSSPNITDLRPFIFQNESFIFAVAWPYHKVFKSTLDSWVLYKEFPGMSPTVDHIVVFENRLYVFGGPSMTFVDLIDGSQTNTTAPPCTSYWPFATYQYLKALCQHPDGSSVIKYYLHPDWDAHPFIIPIPAEEIIGSWQANTSLFLFLSTQSSIYSLNLETLDDPNTVGIASIPDPSLEKASCFSNQAMHYYIGLDSDTPILHRFSYPQLSLPTSTSTPTSTSSSTSTTSSTSSSSSTTLSTSSSSSTSSTSDSTSTSTSDSSWMTSSSCNSSWTPEEETSSSSISKTISSIATFILNSFSTSDSISESSSTLDDRISTSTSTSTSISSWDLSECEKELPEANCDDPVMPFISHSFNLSRSVTLPRSIQILTVMGDMTMTPQAAVVFQLENSGNFSSSRILVEEALYADGIVEIVVPENSGNFEEIFTIFQYEEIFGDFRVTWSRDTVKRQIDACCSVEPKRGSRDYSVKIMCSQCSQETSEISSKSHVGLIVGVVVAGTLIIVIVVVAAILLVLNRRKKSKNLEEELKVVESRDLLANVQVERKIGTGNFGEVFSGRWNGSPVALKKMKGVESPEFFAEVESLSKVIHPNIVQYYGTTVIDDRMYIVMEWMPLGSLVDIIVDIDNPMTLVDIGVQCAAGMMHLSEKKMLHRDVALRNVLMAKSSQGSYLAKISDFGMARSTPSQDYLSHGNVFPVKWCAPEIIQYRTFSSETDVWAFGIMLWELFSKGCKPYPNMTRRQSVDFVMAGRRMQPPSGCPPDIAQLILRTWEKDPQLRPNFATIHEILQKNLISMKSRIETAM